MQGQRDIAGESLQVGEREEQVRLGLKHDPSLLKELTECIAAQNALRHRSGHQIAACSLVANRYAEEVGILQAVFAGSSRAAGSHDPHQLKPRIGLHDESRGSGGTNDVGKRSRYGVDERKRVGVIHMK